MVCWLVLEKNCWFNRVGRKGNASSLRIPGHACQIAQFSGGVPIRRWFGAAGSATWNPIAVVKPGRRPGAASLQFVWRADDTAPCHDTAHSPVVPDLILLKLAGRGLNGRFPSAGPRRNPCIAVRQGLIGFAPPTAAGLAPFSAKTADRSGCRSNAHTRCRKLSARRKSL